MRAEGVVSKIEDWARSKNITPEDGSFNKMVNILIETNPVTGCPDGMVDRNGYCFPADDPCDGITCAEGQVCYEGSFDHLDQHPEISQKYLAV